MPEVMFAGPDGRLEAVIAIRRSGAPVALILHPHPLHGGTMNNRVTYSMYSRSSGWLLGDAVQFSGSGPQPGPL